MTGFCEGTGSGRRARLWIWFYRLAALQFLLTAATGLALYFRPLEGRPGAYSETVKEWLVMLHNGEWLSEALLGNRWVSGILVGLVLAASIAPLAWRTLRGTSSSA